MGPPTCVGGREGGGGGPAIPILSRKFSDCRIFSPQAPLKCSLCDRRLRGSVKFCRSGNAFKREGTYSQFEKLLLRIETVRTPPLPPVFPAVASDKTAT